MQHAQRAAQLMPNEGRYLNLAGIIAETLGEYDKAINYYEQALKSDLASFGEDHPKIARARNNLGIAWASKGEYDKAIQRGDDIVLTTKPTKSVLVNPNTGRLTGYGKEFQYLKDKGYVYDPASNIMIKDK